MQPNDAGMRINEMIQRRTLLSAIPFAFISACARAQPAAASGADMTAPSPTSFASLTGGAGKIGWLSFSGTVRRTRGNSDVRPAKLLRAVKLGNDGRARLFDVWQIEGGAAVAAPSPTLGSANTQAGPNDMGTDSLWLNRNFTHPALNRPVESSRLAPSAARVMAIDATQIWLLEGGILTTAPQLEEPARAAFEAWLVA
jgi:hypothetical protein